jgi:ABC-type Mn2+/Zn2+ transport system permease subunit
MINFLRSLVQCGLCPNWFWGSYAELSILIGISCGLLLGYLVWRHQTPLGWRLALALLPGFAGGILTGWQAFGFSRAGHVGAMSVEDAIYSFTGAAVFGVMSSTVLLSATLAQFYLAKCRGKN